MHVRNTEILFLHREIVFRKILRNTYHFLYVIYNNYSATLSRTSNVKLIIRRLVNELVWNFLIYFTRFIYACICTQSESDYNDQ